MRLRAHHIAIFVVVALTAFVGFVVYRQGQAPAVTTSLDRDEAFIETVRQRAEAQRGGADERGTLPGATVGAQFVPEIDLGMEIFDGGVISNDQHTVFEVTVHNRGMGSLVISDIQTTCAACTLGRMASETPIPAGQSGTLLITLRPDGIPGFESNQNLIIMSNDPRHPRTILPVHVEVEREFELEPMRFDFGTVTQGEEVSRTMHFRTLQEEPIEITDITWVEYGDQRLDYAVETTPADTWARPGYPEYEITVSLKPDAIPGDDWTEYFLIHNSTQRLARFRCPATGTVLPGPAPAQESADASS